MNKHQHNASAHKPTPNSEVLLSGTYIIADEWSSTQDRNETLDGIFIAESIVTRPARTLGDSVAASDQDVVDLVGRAADVVYDDDEPLDFAEKIGQRDRDRWELDLVSVDPDIKELSEEPPVPVSQREGVPSEKRS